MKNGTVNTLRQRYKINTRNDEYFYTENSILPFGKHKGNTIKCIFKCETNYIEWCLTNADSFCINLDTLKIMQITKPWISDDLDFFQNSEEFILDIRTFEKDKNGFPYSNRIREANFSFSANALEENRIKLATKLNAYNVLRGGDWSSSNPISFKGTTKKNKNTLRLNQFGYT
ncbi:exodeoxyribonuclease X C-terminal domain-containing protein [Adhaeribacter arboris]|nr:hypothetical protein [Adhaeribacter arboris]